MTEPKAALTWWSFVDRGVEAGELIRAAASVGYDGIEIADEEYWPAIADAGLAIASHRGHATLESGLNAVANHDRIERELLANIELAEAWGKPVLICFSGNRNGVSDEEGVENTALGLSRVARAAEEAGVTLALELLNSKIDHPDYQCDRTGWGLEVIARVDSPAVKLLYDVYHMQVMEGDVIRTIESHNAAFAHYHVAGNPGRHEPDLTQELWYPAIYTAIVRTGYTGWVGMEYVPKGDPVDSLRVSLETFREAVRDA
jgi:hydroxypyruvate isomerase